MQPTVKGPGFGQLLPSQGPMLLILYARLRLGGKAPQQCHNRAKYIYIPQQMSSIIPVHSEVT